MSLFRIDRMLVNIKSDIAANKKADGGESAPIESAEETGHDSAPSAYPPESTPAGAEENVKEVVAKAEERVKKAFEEADEIKKAAEKIKADAEKKALETLETARKEAEEIIGSAKSAKEKAEAEGYRKGKEKAREEARAELEEERVTAAERLSQMIAELAAGREKLLADYEDEIIILCMSIVRKVISTAIDEDDEAYNSIVRKALSQANTEGKITLRVSESEYERFFKEGSPTFVLGDKSVTASVVEDPSLKAGACVIESEGETVNAGVDSQLKYISLAFHRAEGEQ